VGGAEDKNRDTELAARPGLQSESNFRFRCYRTPNVEADRASSAAAGSTSRMARKPGRLSLCR
jgi:hypothetical protein